MRQELKDSRIPTVTSNAKENVDMLYNGRSAAGKDAAKTHTGALSGDYEVMAAQVVARGAGRERHEGENGEYTRHGRNLADHPASRILPLSRPCHE